MDILYSKQIKMLFATTQTKYPTNEGGSVSKGYNSQVEFSYSLLRVRSAS